MPKHVKFVCLTGQSCLEIGSSSKESGRWPENKLETIQNATVGEVL